VGRLHHVNLAVHVGDVEAEVEWLTAGLGLSPLAPPDDMTSVLWFADDDGVQVHVSVDPDHAPAQRAHVAIELADLGSAKEWLVAAGGNVDERDFGGNRVVFCRDPGGNRWELRSPLP